MPDLDEGDLIPQFLPNPVAKYTPTQKIDATQATLTRITDTPYSPFFGGTAAQLIAEAMIGTPAVVKASAEDVYSPLHLDIYGQAAKKYAASIRFDTQILSDHGFKDIYVRCGTQITFPLSLNASNAITIPSQVVDSVNWSTLNYIALGISPLNWGLSGGYKDFTLTFNQTVTPTTLAGATFRVVLSDYIATYNNIDYPAYHFANALNLQTRAQPQYSNRIYLTNIPKFLWFDSVLNRNVSYNLRATLDIFVKVLEADTDFTYSNVPFATTQNPTHETVLG